MVSEEQIYKDPVEIVKIAVSSSCENNRLLGAITLTVIPALIKAVHSVLKEINK